MNVVMVVVFMLMIVVVLMLVRMIGSVSGKFIMCVCCDGVKFSVNVVLCRLLGICFNLMIVLCMMGNSV